MVNQLLMNVPIEILNRYAAGERDIRVSPQIYRDYCAQLTACYRRQPDEHYADNGEQWTWYRLAKVSLQP